MIAETGSVFTRQSFLKMIVVCGRGRVRAWRESDRENVPDVVSVLRFSAEESPHTSLLRLMS